MSVQGTILVLDGVSTNRIMLKVQLTAAWYHVVQGEKLAGLGALLRRTRPDLVLTAQTLPDGTASDVKKLMAVDPTLADVPIVAITPQNDRTARLKALSDGLDDVLGYPFKDTLLLARVRSLLRSRADRQELRLGDGNQSIGFGEAAQTPLAPPAIAQIALLTQTPRAGALWGSALAQQTRYRLSNYTLPDLHGVFSEPAPDAIVVELAPGGSGGHILADLKSRSATRNTVLIGVLSNEDATLAAEALDKGADAICMGGFHPDEISLRLDTQIARKTRDDKLRASIRKDLSESLTDPLTGLHNRRFAMRALDQIARQALKTGRGFALMLADLDHFKAINDRFGHVGGDIVLTETARRLQAATGKVGFVARIGGEEFMIGLPHCSAEQALKHADMICESICNKPFYLPDESILTSITISVGVKWCSSPDLNIAGRRNDVGQLIRSADQALYAAKNAGRNQVHIRSSAA